MKVDSNWMTHLIYYEPMIKKHYEASYTDNQSSYYW